MRAAIAFLAAACVLCGDQHGLPLADAKAGWVVLFDQETLFGWGAEHGAQWRVQSGALQSATPAGWLRTDAAFADFILTFEFDAPPGSEGRIAFRWSGDWPVEENSYVVQLGGGASGTIQGLSSASVSARPGWQTAEITAIGDHITLVINGETAADVHNSKFRSGQLGVAHIRGSSFAIRKVRLKPQGLDPLFNGKDLSGWQTLTPPPPQKKPGSGGPFGMFKKMGGMLSSSKPPEPAQWSVAAGAIHVEHGTGLLMHTGAYDNFVLQVEMQTVSRDISRYPEAGIFLRTDPKIYGSGYKVQVSNEYSGKHGSEPVRFGTGGIYGLSPARRIVSQDNDDFVETIAASGRRICVWINGYPVTDYYDVRAENSDVLAGARLTAGGIALEAHDSGTIADFRSVRAAVFTKGAPAIPAVANAGTSAAPPMQSAATLPSAAAPVPAAPGLPAPSTAQPPGPDPRLRELAGQALKENDPNRKLQLADQILEIDPSSPLGAQLRSEANAAIEKRQQQEREQQARAAAEAAQQQQQALKAQAAEAEKQRNLDEAENALVAGNLASARERIAAASRIAPLDPEVRRIKNAIDLRERARQRLLAVGAGAGFAVLLASVGAWWRRRGAAEPYLEILEGPEKGKRYPLTGEVVHIGAIPQDGAQKNEIVIRDPECMISRFHCQIHRRGSELYLVDCKSANGTRLNRRRLKAGEYVRLKNGTIVELGGSCEVRVRFEKRANEKGAGAS